MSYPFDNNISERLAPKTIRCGGDKAINIKSIAIASDFINQSSSSEVDAECIEYYYRKNVFIFSYSLKFSYHRYFQAGLNVNDSSTTRLKNIIESILHMLLVANVHGERSLSAVDFVSTVDNFFITSSDEIALFDNILDFKLSFYALSFYACYGMLMDKRPGDEKFYHGSKEQAMKCLEHVLNISSERGYLQEFYKHLDGIACSYLASYIHENMDSIELSRIAKRMKLTMAAIS